jgi:hypothetical protein
MAIGRIGSITRSNLIQMSRRNIKRRRNIKKTVPDRNIKKKIKGERKKAGPKDRRNKHFKR